MELNDPTERALTAGEYVLGTLEPAERDVVEQALPGNEALRRDVYWWESRLAQVGLQLRPSAPRPLVWLNLMHAIQSAPAPTPLDGRPPKSAARLTTLWASLATAASVALSFALYLEMSRPAPEPIVVTERIEVPVRAEAYVALLKVEDSTMQWSVSVVPDQRTLAIRASGEAPAAASARDAELWLITDAGPVSLGVIPKAGDLRRDLPADLTVGDGRVFAVSLEPEGGSPTGQPTGPVVSTAELMLAG